MAAVAAPLAIAGTGLQIMGGLSAANAQAAGYRHSAAQAERRALAARTAADQTSAFMRDELTTTLGNIEAIRAAAGVTLDSPTGMAIYEREKKESDRQRNVKVGNLLSQAAMSDSDADFYRYAAGHAESMGILGAFGRGIGGLSGLARGL
jgi:hypothetical protein